jgi:KaiC/GvpD/RAD55 family RecA-like ATPase
VYPYADLLYEYSSTYLSRNMEDDREKAYSLLNEALKIYEGIDALKKAEKTREKIIETGQTTVVPEPVTIERVKVTSTERITTGYADLDDLLFGGMPKNYAVILTSHSCDEKDLLIRKFLEAGAKSGEVTFHVTIDPGEVISLAEEFQSNFYLFICNPEANTMVRDLPNVFKIKGVENLTDVNIALSSAFQKLDKTSSGIRRACFEIISDVLMQHRAVSTRRWLTALIPKLRSKGFTTLAVLEPGIHSLQDVRAIVGTFEGEINICEKSSGEFLKIKKMYNQQYSDSELFLNREKLRT